MNEDNLKAIVIPPNPDHEYFNCRKTNQNALRGETFWVLDYHRKIVRYDDGREAEKYILLCRRHLDDSSENNFKFFTGSIDIKHKLTFEEAKQELAGHWGWIKHSNSKNLQKSINKKLGYNDNIFGHYAA